MSLASELQKPTVSNQFLLELTAGFWLRGFVQHSGNTYKLTVSDYTSASPNAPTEVRWNGALMTQLATALDVTTTLNSWAYVAGVFYVRGPTPSVTPHANTVVATFPFYFSSRSKIFNNQFYDPRLIAVPSQSLRIEQKFSGVGQVGNGSCQLSNSDGYFNELSRVMNWDYGRAVFKMGIDSNVEMVYSDYQTLGTWSVERTESKDQSFQITLRSLTSPLERNIPVETFNQTDYPQLSQNDVGKVIPIAYGKIFGAKPICVDPGTKRFKLAGHAIYDILEIRIQNDNVWSVTNPTYRDLANGEFLLGSDWSDNQPVSVDFIGKKLSDGRPMYNASDIVADLLSYLAYGRNANVVAGALVLRDAVSGNWFANQVDRLTGEWLSPVPTLAPSGATDTVSIFCPTDGSTHSVGVVTDAGGAVVLYVEQTASGTAVATALNGWLVQIFKDSGGFYYVDTVSADLETSSFRNSFNSLDVGLQNDGIRRTILKPSLYLNSSAKALDTISAINTVAGSFLYVNPSGLWHYEVFEPKALGSVDFTFSDIDLVDQRLTEDIDASFEPFSKAIVTYARREQDGYVQTIEQNRTVNRYAHASPSAETTKNIDAPLWEESDAKLFAQRILSTEGIPLTTYQFEVPWQAFFVLPGKQIHLTYSPLGIDTVVEVLEVKHDLINCRITIIAGDRRGWRDAFGWWVSDSQPAWNPADSVATKLSNKQTSGYWHGDNNLAESTDGKSSFVSQWW
jgi:hypothetical protein